MLDYAVRLEAEYNAAGPPSAPLGDISWGEDHLAKILVA
jgi:hypothetical protein